jgi:hypothetical protein
MSTQKIDELTEQILINAKSLMKSSAILYSLAKNKQFATKTMTVTSVIELCKHILFLHERLEITIEDNRQARKRLNKTKEFMESYLGKPE